MKHPQSICWAADAEWDHPVVSQRLSENRRGNLSPISVQVTLNTSLVKPDPRVLLAREDLDH